MRTKPTERTGGRVHCSPQGVVHAAVGLAIRHVLRDVLELTKKIAAYLAERDPVLYAEMREALYQDLALSEGAKDALAFADFALQGRDREGRES